MMCRLIKLLTLACYTWIHCDAQEEGLFSARAGLHPQQVAASAWHPRSPRVAVRANDTLPCDKPTIYFCEEPPNLIPPESSKACNYRNIWYQEQVFRWVAGRGCLLYTPNFLFVGGRNPINLNTGCVYGNFFAPCLEVVKEDGTCGCFPFDPSLEVVSRAVRAALVPATRGRWERCFYEASDCCSHFMNGNHNVAENNQCPPTFDGWTCWQPTENGSVARSVCPEFAYSNSGPICQHFSHKQCHSHGVWEVQTDYTTCSVTPRLLSRYRYYIAVLAFSVATSLPAICIFIFYKRLRVTRVALHRNLLIAIVLRNIVVIISRNVIYIDELTNSGDTIMSQNGVPCRILAFAERLAGNAVFVCMLVEGIYLHRLIVAVFKRKISITMLYLVGVLLTVVPVIAWSIAMSLHNDHSCWLVYTLAHVQWAVDAPRLLVLLINAALYIDVLRVLFTKIRNNENANQLNTAKATLFLMPIFGVQFLFTVFRPYTTNCELEQTYYIVAYTIEGLQGFVVALLYCYINKEVHALIKATYKKVKETATSRIKGSSYYPRISGDPKTDRRFTYTSALTTNTAKADESKYQYLTMEPKIHVAEIISIQASERLAEILEPVYETIDNGLNSEGYDCLERSNADCDTEFTQNRSFNKIDEYYGFTNASSISVGCPEWLRPVSSSSSSIYNTSIEASHAKQEENPGDTNSLDTNTFSGQNDEDSKKYSELNTNGIDNLSECTSNNNVDNEKELDTLNYNDECYGDLKIDCGNCKNMLDEIMQCMEVKEDSDVKLNPEVLAPNRSEGDKIVFVEE